LALKLGLEVLVGLILDLGQAVLVAIAKGAPYMRDLCWLASFKGSSCTSSDVQMQKHIIATILDHN
jgi:hypothetical protein